MTLAYQRKRLQHQDEVTGLVEAYQKEILKTQLEMQEQTFLAISQEIHDNVGQVLSLVRLNMSTMNVAENTILQQKVNTSKELLDQAIQDLRNLSKILNSKYVSQQSLSDLLKFQLGLIQRTGAVETGIEVHGEVRTLDSEKKLIIYRIAQEALSNIIKHADANSIKAKLTYMADRLSLSITDDGKGFIASSTSPGEVLAQGTGIHNMYYRAKLIGATLHVESKPGLGSLVLLELPFN